MAVRCEELRWTVKPYEGEELHTFDGGTVERTAMLLTRDCR